MRAELVAIGEVKNISITENDTRRAEVVDRDTKRIEKDEDLLIEATNMHTTIAKSLWQIKLQKNSNLEFQDMDTDSDMNT